MGPHQPTDRIKSGVAIEARVDGGRRCHFALAAPSRDGHPAEPQPSRLAPVLDHNSPRSARWGRLTVAWPDWPTLRVDRDTCQRGRNGREPPVKQCDYA